MDWYGRARNYVATGLWLAVVTCSSATSLCGQTATQVPAVVGTKPLKLEDTGLAQAPADAAFFSTSLNLKQAWQQQLESGWVAEVRRLPYAQRLEQFLQEQWDNPQPQAQQVKTFLSSPIVRDIVSLLGDMSAQEIFLYGDHSWCAFMKAVADFQYQVSQFNSGDEEEIREYLLGLEKADIDAVPIPKTVIGFQLSDDENARTQLDALQGILQLAFSNIEPLKPIAEGLRRKDLNNGQILSMSLRADDIPWQSIPMPNDDNGEVIDHIAELLAGRKIVISIGVIDKRLYIATSDSPDTLLNLKPDANLLTSKAMAPLIKSKPANLRGVSFASADWRNAVWESNFGNYFERLSAQFSRALNESVDDQEDLEAWQEKLKEDCEWLDKKIAEMIPEFADMLAYSYRSNDGLETYSYDWTPSWLLENAQPLAVSRHGGTAPLLLFASRMKWFKEVGEIYEAVLDTIPEHIELLHEAGVIEDDDAEKIDEVVDKVLPIIQDMVSAVREEIVPALDGNESLTAVTAQATTTRLSEDAPPPPQALPLLEMGIVLKMKNKDQFLGGCDEILRGINALIDFAREQDPDSVPPNVRVPDPEEETLPGGGTRYWFTARAPAPFEQFELQMAINKDVAVLGYSTRQVRDLYQDRPLAARPAWYSADKPTAAVGFVDVAGIFRALKPWVLYGLSMTGSELDEPLGPSQGGAPVPTGNDVLQFWDTFQKLGKAAGTTVVDKDDVTVSHWIWVGE